MAGYKTRSSWSAPDIQFDSTGKRIRPEALKVEPTGRRVFHPRTCGGCRGNGCPEVRLVRP